jgi:L-ascorbate metabolism protein UlaG (beta-lactamase superfamily)
VIYRNLDGSTPDRGFFDLLKWQSSRKREIGRFVPPMRPNDGAALKEAGAHMTWIGHATYALRLGGKNIVTDPIWTERLGTRRRRAPAGVALDDMFAIDVVTISHSHYDHLDLRTLRRIMRAPASMSRSPTYVVPRDNAEILRGFPNVVELAWWESFDCGDVKITLVPAQHWSMRFPWDRNKRLWGGFVYESADGVAYHAGDTAFSDVTFGAIADRFPKIDWAMLPIGAYDPPWFMKPQHMGPEEATRVWEILGARNLCAMHWGTFKLTDEPMGEPPERLRAAFTEKKHDAARAWIFDIGETRRLR